MNIVKEIAKTIPSNHQWRKENSIDAIGNDSGWEIASALRKLIVINLSVETTLQTTWSLWYEFHKAMSEDNTITAEDITNMYYIDYVQDNELLATFLNFVSSNIYLIPQFTYHTMSEWSEGMKNLYTRIFEIQELLLQEGLDVPTQYIDAFMSINSYLVSDNMDT